MEASLAIQIIICVHFPAIFHAHALVGGDEFHEIHF